VAEKGKTLPQDESASALHMEEMPASLCIRQRIGLGAAAPISLVN